MSDKSRIEWTDATWTPVRALRRDTGKVGVHCERVSPACTNCYAATFNRRNLPSHGTGLDFIVPNREKVDIFVDEDMLLAPLRWKRGRKIFVNSQTDTWGEFVSSDQIDSLFAIAKIAGHHTYQFLTKRADRMRDYMSDQGTAARVARRADSLVVDFEMNGVDEAWRDITGFEGIYSVSNYGRVRSRGEKMLSLNAERNGYLKVSLSKNGIVAQKKVHQLVLEAFYRSRQDGEESLHRNRNVEDNRIANLRWGTKSQNMLDAVRHGSMRSPAIDKANLSSFQVSEIRRLRASGVKLLEIAYAVGAPGGKRQVHEVASGRIYSDSANWPPNNCWLGVTAENQEWADKRIPLLLQTPAAKRFVSVEPMLGPVELDLRGIDWVICGGESGRGARPMHPDWARSLRDQCQAAGVPFFFKQWGAWQNGSGENWDGLVVLNDGRVTPGPEEMDLETRNRWPRLSPTIMCKVGKHAAGRLLDGREWSEFPEVSR